MKNLIRISFSALLCLSLETPVLAQETSIAKYWVVESNIRIPGTCLVQLYNGNNCLVHEIKLTGVKFDITRKKHRGHLNKILSDFNRHQIAPASVKR